MDWLWNLDSRYRGVDFLGMALSFVSIWQLARKRRSGFLVGAMANGAWLTFAFMAQSAATVYANVLFGCMNLYAWWRWKHEEAAPTSSGR
jgi:nicotinamide riboside transporter PnuC